MSIKKSRYVRKIDFLNYFDRPDVFWYLNNAEIEGVFSSYFSSAKNKIDIESFDEDVEQDINESIEFDVLSLYKDNKEIKLTDENDPRVIEGQLIYNEFKSFISRYCKQTMNIFKVYDFDEMFPLNKFELETRYNETLKFINTQNEPYLLLNPVFICNNAVSIPYAIVFDNNGYEIIDAKSTTTTKRIDILDFYYQIKIVNSCLKNLSKKLRDAFLCLIAYEQKPKNSVSFTITNYLKYTKNGNLNLHQDISKKIKEEDAFYSKRIINLKQKLKKNGQLKISDLINEDFENLKFLRKEKIDLNNVVNTNDKLQVHKEKNNLYKIEIILQNELIFIRNNFFEIIKKLNDHIFPLVIVVPFAKEFDSYWHKFKYLNVIRKILGKEYDVFNYSGKIIKWTDAYDYVQMQKKLKIFEYDMNSWLNYKLMYKKKDFLLLTKNNWNKNDLQDKLESFNWRVNSSIKKWFFLLNKQKINKNLKLHYFVTKNAISQINEIKSKKIYFDFETINQCIRVIDDSLPYMQIVTQCSILKYDENNPNKDCLNLIVDPQNITKDFFKQIIDSLYVENTYEYSYIVYNKSFEINRLLEMQSILNDPFYTKKIKAIIANVYDLADLFNFAKDNIYIKELKGFYSIKIVLSIIPDKFLNETKTVNYNSLAIKRGDRAQALTSLRFLNKINDKKWKNISNDLCMYCENDVRAMIAVELFAKYLIANYSNNKENENLNKYTTDQLILEIAASNNVEEKKHLINQFIQKIDKLSEKDKIH